MIAYVWCVLASSSAAERVVLSDGVTYCPNTGHSF